MPFADLQTSLLRCHLLICDFIILLCETFSERRHTMKDLEALMTFVNSDQSSWGKDPCLLFITDSSGMDIFFENKDCHLLIHWGFLITWTSFFKQSDCYLFVWCEFPGDMTITTLRCIIIFVGEFPTTLLFWKWTSRQLNAFVMQRFKLSKWPVIEFNPVMSWRENMKQGLSRCFEILSFLEFTFEIPSDVHKPK